MTIQVSKNSFKAMAKRIAAETPLKHCQALDLLSQTLGYAGYNAIKPVFEAGRPARPARSAGAAADSGTDIVSYIRSQSPQVFTPPAGALKWEDMDWGDFSTRRIAAHLSETIVSCNFTSFPAPLSGDDRPREFTFMFCVLNSASMFRFETGDAREVLEDMLTHGTQVACLKSDAMDKARDMPLSALSAAYLSADDDLFIPASGEWRHDAQSVALEQLFVIGKDGVLTPLRAYYGI